MPIYTNAAPIDRMLITHILCHSPFLTLVPSLFPTLPWQDIQPSGTLTFLNANLGRDLQATWIGPQQVLAPASKFWDLVLWNASWTNSPLDLASDPSPALKEPSHTHAQHYSPACTDDHPAIRGHICLP